MCRNPLKFPVQKRTVRGRALSDSDEPYRQSGAAMVSPLSTKRASHAAGRPDQPCASARQRPSLSPDHVVNNCIVPVRSPVSLPSLPCPASSPSTSSNIEQGLQLRNSSKNPCMSSEHVIHEDSAAAAPTAKEAIRSTSTDASCHQYPDPGSSMREIQLLSGGSHIAVNHMSSQDHKFTDF
jgi:hypothetical protein